MNGAEWIWIPEDADRLIAHEIRYIDTGKRVTRWLLEGSADGENYFPIADKRQAQQDLGNDFVMPEGGVRVRYLKLTVLEVPFRQRICVSGLRVFGRGEGEKPAAQQAQAKRVGDLDMLVSWADTGAVGYNVLWGYAPDKLYHSYMVFGAAEKKIGALMKGEPVWVRVDAFNEVGVTEGEVFPLD